MLQIGLLCKKWNQKYWSANWHLPSGWRASQVLTAYDLSQFTCVFMLAVCVDRTAHSSRMLHSPSSRRKHATLTPRDFITQPKSRKVT